MPPVFLQMFFSESDKGILLAVKITPNARALSVKGVFCDAGGQEFLRISVVSVPEKGKANKELTAFLSKELGMSKSDIEIVGGETSHLKRILLKQKDNGIIAKLNEWSKIK